MKLLKIIYETDIGLKSKKLNINYEIREATRVVIFNKKNEVAILHVTKHQFYKLPGGGLEKDENIIDALAREVLEETGYEIGNIEELGKIISYRNEFKKIQKDYGYTAKTINKIQDPKYTFEEEKSGFELEWKSIDEAIKLIQNSTPTDYADKFMRVRDLVFLEKVKN